MNGIWVVRDECQVDGRAHARRRKRDCQAKAHNSRIQGGRGPLGLELTCRSVIGPVVRECSRKLCIWGNPKFLSPTAACLPVALWDSEIFDSLLSRTWKFQGFRPQNSPYMHDFCYILSPTTCTQGLKTQSLVFPPRSQQPLQASPSTFAPPPCSTP